MQFTDVTPNLIVADIERSTTFYRDVLGFSVVTTVPEQGPFAFVWVQRGSVNIFLNSRESANQENSFWKSRELGGTASLFVQIEASTPADGVDALFQSVQQKTPVLMELKDQFYGMREFALQDPDGYVLIFAQRIA